MFCIYLEVASREDFTGSVLLGVFLPYTSNFFWKASTEALHTLQEYEHY